MTAPREKDGFKRIEQMMTVQYICLIAFLIVMLVVLATTLNQRFDVIDAALGIAVDSLR